MINGLTLLLAGSAVIHIGFIAWCLRVWMRQPVTGPARMQEEFLPQVSIVIPVRNEAATIVRTVESVALQQYPADRFELIIVDDGSSDRTAETAQSAFDRFPALRSSILSLKDQGSKKAAIEAGVRAASGDWILATDGDTYFGPLWMKSMMRAALSPGVKLVCGPVITVPKDRLSLVGRTAAAESIGLTVIAGAGILSGHPFFCNGANMAYQKAHFAALKGFDSASGRLSGDDTELLIRTPATEVRYVGTPSAAVRTEAPESLLEFVSQRQRWASKIPVSLSGTTFFFALCSWLCHALLIVSLTGCFGWELPVVAWSVKSFVESALLKVSGRSFTEPVSLPLILILQPFYALAVLLVGVTAVVMPYRWKGRKGH